MRIEPGAFDVKEKISNALWHTEPAPLLLSLSRKLCSPYFTSLLAILQCSKRHGPCLLQVSNTHALYSRSSMATYYVEGLPPHMYRMGRTCYYYVKVIMCDVILRTTTGSKRGRSSSPVFLFLYFVTLIQSGVTCFRKLSGPKTLIPEINWMHLPETMHLFNVQTFFIVVSNVKMSSQKWPLLTL